jgi:hypothetical protein
MWRFSRPSRPLRAQTILFGNPGYYRCQVQWISGVDGWAGWQVRLRGQFDRLGLGSDFTSIILCKQVPHCLCNDLRTTNKGV